VTEIIGSELSLCGKSEVKAEAAKNSVNFMEHARTFKIGSDGTRIYDDDDMPE
jgi:hypothetical protein